MTATLAPTEYSHVGSGGGGGKGGGAGSRPQEAPNTLRSSSRATIVYAVAAGEIQGWGNEPFKRIYLDNQPIQNPDGTFNFKDVTIDYRTGTNFQSAMPGFTDVASEFGVGVKLTASGGPIIRTLSDENADAVVLRLSVSSLQRYDDKEGAVGTRVAFTVAMSVDGGPSYTVFSDAFDGKSSGPYEQSYRIPLYKPGKDYRISITRTTPDSNSTKVQDELVWQSYTSLIDVPLTYPNVATFGIGLNAEQFNNIPPVGLDVGGWICDVPTNYNASTRAYTGLWDGTFKREYTNNPAWLFYYLCKEDINGCGRHIDANKLDKAAFYQIGKYCDELVPDGFGGFEPRFVCNAYLDQADDAYNVLNTLASVFRGMVYWSNGLITATQDSPTNYTRYYGEENTLQEVDDQGNITKPNFNYAGTGSKARHTVVLVTYFDKDDFHKQKIEVVQDLEAVARYGYHETTVTAFGCDSRGQAKRVGEWLLYTENNETEVINFGVPSDGMLCRPGEVIRTIDPTRSGRRQTGRIAAVTGLSVTLDIPWSTLSATSGQTLSVLNPTDGKQVTYTVASLHENPLGYTVATIIGSWGAVDSSQLVNTPWMIQTADLLGESWRVFGVTEDDRHQFSITATKHNPSKYGAIERGLTLDVIPTSIVGDISKPPLPPSTITWSESLYESRSAGLRIRLDLAWTASKSSQVDRYRIEYQKLGTSISYIALPETRSTFVRIDDFVAGQYLFRVQAVNRLGLRSDFTETVLEVYGKTSPPNAVTGLIAVALDRQLKLQWDESPDLDVRVGGQFIIKYTPKITGVSWTDGFQLELVSGASTAVTLPNVYGTYMIKAVDSTKNESLNHTQVVSDPTTQVGQNIVATITENSVFAGVKTGLIVSNGLLQLAPNTFWDSLDGLVDALPGLIDSLSGTTIDSLPGNVDALPGLWDGERSFNNVTSGIYEFANSIDLGAIYTSRISALVSTINTNTNINIDSIPGLIDAQLGNWDQSLPEKASATLEISKSDNNITFSPWQRFIPGDYRGRILKFRVVFASDSSTANVLMDQLRVTIDMPDRTERGRTDSFNTVIFSAAFRAPPIITPSIVSPAQGDYVTIINLTATGFIAQAYNANGQAITKQIDWLATGYGTSIP